MKKLFITMMAAFVVIVLTACSGNGSSDEEVLVKSDAGNVTKDELYKKLKESGNAAQVLQNMVFTQWLEDNYDVSDEVDKQVKKTKDQFDDEDKFKSALQQQGYEDEDALREAMKPQLLLQKATTDGVKVSDKEIQDYYDKNKDQFATVDASHIAVDKEDKAKSIKKELDNGSDFAEMAKENSTDKDTAEDGGKLGTIDSSSSDVDPTIVQTAMGMDKGDVSDPVQTQTGGFEIIKVTGKGTKKIDDVKDQIKDTLTQQKAKSQFDVLKELKKKENFEINDDDFKDAFDIDKLQKQAQQQQMQQQLQQMQPGQ